MTQMVVADTFGVFLFYMNRITKGREQIVNKTFVRMYNEGALTIWSKMVFYGCEEAGR